MCLERVVVDEMMLNILGQVKALKDHLGVCLWIFNWSKWYHTIDIR